MDIFRTTKPEAPETILFNADGTFTFTITHPPLTRVDKPKQVYIGRFERAHNDEAPKGLSLETDYCLKTATIRFPLNRFSTPHARYFWDFIPLKGDHLREILCMNDETEEMLRLLANNKIDPYANDAKGVHKSFDCMIIEPCYKPFDPRFSNLVNTCSKAELTLKKLDALLQITKGLQELYANTLYQRAAITAHRDMKFQNVVIDTLSPLHLRIIDFPSIKLLSEGTEEDLTAASTFTPSNTAPEDVISKKDNPAMIVSEKTDVFALGMMLGEMFGGWVCKSEHFARYNPLIILFEKSNTNYRNAQSCRAHYLQWIGDYYHKDGTPHNDYNTARHWVEESLNELGYNSNWTDLLPGSVQSLFRRATDLFPKNRPTVAEFEAELTKIRDEFASQDTVQFTHLMVLVDQIHLDAMRDRYLKAAKPLLEQATKEHGRITADIVTFRQGGEPVLVPRSGELTIKNSSLTTCFDDFAALVKRFDSFDPQEDCKSHLRGCLYEAFVKMNQLSETAHVIHDIHVFCPYLPTETTSVPFLIPETGDCLTFEAMADHHPDFRIVIHSSEAGPSTSWYTSCPLDGAASASAAPITGTTVTSAINHGSFD